MLCHQLSSTATPTQPMPPLTPATCHTATTLPASSAAAGRSAGAGPARTPVRSAPTPSHERHRGYGSRIRCGTGRAGHRTYRLTELGRDAALGVPGAQLGTNFAGDHQQLG